MRSSIALPLLLSLLLIAPNPTNAAPKDHPQPAAKNRPIQLLLPLPSKKSVHRRLTKNLLLRIDADAGGYDLAVYHLDKSGRPDPDDLLYHSLQWHGPYPSQVDAWHFATKQPFFPLTRILPIYNHPYQLRVTIKNPTVQGPTTDAHFTSGQVQIRLERAQPKLRG